MRTATDGRIERGNQTRRVILQRAVQIASVEGLDGLSPGRLVGELDLSKSGVFALFGSKEELQLATVRSATEVFIEHVVQPARDLSAGPGRVRCLCDNWLTCSAQRVFPGGCFFYSLPAECDARQGKVHDAAATAHGNWFTLVERMIDDAREAGEIRAGTTPPSSPSKSSPCWRWPTPNRYCRATSPVTAGRPTASPADCAASRPIRRLCPTPFEPPATARPAGPEPEAPCHLIRSCRPCTTGARRRASARCTP